jgi:hypothetical protein
MLREHPLRQRFPWLKLAPLTSFDEEAMNG